jgi:hypothetical protein
MSKLQRTQNVRFWITVFTALLGCGSVHAADHFLVASNRSNSIEEFDLTGKWLRTFATTGPYAPVALAQSPTTGEIFVTTMWPSGPAAGQLTNKILRYKQDGTFDVNWDTFTVTCPSSVCPTTATQSLVFGPYGDLWVATAYGQDLGGPIWILNFRAADLTTPNPAPQPSSFKTAMYRGNQMAFKNKNELCIAGFIDEDVKCFDTSTGTQTADYYAEIHASSVSPVIQPGGLAFDSSGSMYLTSVFGGQVVKEVVPGGPIVLLAKPAPAPFQLDGNLFLQHSTGNLFTTLYSTAPVTYSSPDLVSEISVTSGLMTSFIWGAAAPGLGNDHIWGAYWIISYCYSSCPGFLIPLPPSL